MSRITSGLMRDSQSWSSWRSVLSLQLRVVLVQHIPFFCLFFPFCLRVGRLGGIYEVKGCDVVRFV